MRKTSLPFWAIFLSVLQMQIDSFSSELALEDPPAPLRISVKHIEGKGIGYKEGYSTLEALFVPTHKFNTIVPLLDARMHVFNNGLPAANAGIGLRYLSSRTWGANAYYDFRKTNRRNYNQVALGVESLGKIWDFRINGYLPVAGKVSSPYAITFDRFSGHSIILSEKKEFALKSIQAEIATHAIKIRHNPSYFAIGPYYLNGKKEAAWGGKARLAFTAFDYLRIEGSASYDTLFKGIVQGSLSVNIPLGPKRSTLRTKFTCAKENLMLKQAHQRVDHNEIIPVDANYFTTAAINPATQTPYKVWFVDNTSSSKGTYESPFPTLALAESHSNKNDIIYIFPGNGSSEGLNTGFVMKKGQRLFGSGVNQIIPTQQKGSIVNITIPAMTKSLPLLALITSPGYNTGIVTLADSCEVSGLHIISSDNLLGQKLAAIMGGPATTVASIEDGVKNPYIHNNWIEGAYYEGGIYLHNTRNSFTIENNSLENIDGLNAITCLNELSHKNLSVNINQNTVSDPSGGGIYFENTPGTNVSNQEIKICYNKLTGVFADGISITNNGHTASSSIRNQEIMILGNTLSDITENAILVLNNERVSVSYQNTFIADNIINTTSNGRGIFVYNSGIGMSIGNQYINVSYNDVVGSSLEGVYVVNYNEVALGSQSTEIHGNRISGAQTRGIAFSNELIVTSVSQFVLVKGNIIENSAEGGIYMQNEGPSTSHPACFILQNNFIDSSTNFGITTESFGESFTNSILQNNQVQNTNTASSGVFISHDSSTICTDIIYNHFDQNLIFTEEDTSEILLAPLTQNTLEEIIGSYTSVSSGTCDCR